MTNVKTSKFFGSKASSMASLAPWLIQPYAEVSNTVDRFFDTFANAVGIGKFQDCMFI